MSEALPSTSATDPVQAGRDAMARHAWQEAFEQLSLADGEGQLTGDDLEAFAGAAFFSARADLALGIKERAFQARQADGDVVRAAYLALEIASLYRNSGKQSISSAWVRRAERIIGIIGPDGETYAHGHLALIQSESAAAAGDLEGALTLAERAVEIGDHAFNADLRAYAMTNLGALKIASGATSDGFALMEEAAIDGVNGELSPFATGITTCRLIGACRDMTDYRRATEWIEATEKYCARQSLSGFPGVCRIHRAEVAAVGGGWERAELELEQATIELSGYNATPPQADGFYAIGDIRRLKGDFEGAEASLREAHARGRSPQPALALLRLAEGKVRAAADAINAAVAEETWDRWARARLLPAQVEIAIAAGDVKSARTAIDELAGIVVGYPSPALEAGRQVALGRVLVAEGEGATAAHELRAGINGWREVGAPYEVARARAVLSRALRALGSDEDADLELRAALDEFRRLGARIDVEAGERELRDADDRRSGPMTARKTFMFTDIVGSTNVAEVMGDQAWQLVLRTHDDLIRTLIADGGGEVVNSTGDGFFAAFDSARRGVDCAISIQRALRDHRARTSFVPPVRIGLHTAEANKRGTDYSGKGVHVAARIGALADGGEILVTAETLAEAGDIPASDLRSSAVKGVAEPVSFVSIAWT